MGTFGHGVVPAAPLNIRDTTHLQRLLSRVLPSKCGKGGPDGDGGLSEFSRELGCAGILGITRGFLLATSFHSLESPGPGLAGNVSLALFKVAIICPISRWLRSALRGGGKTLMEEDSEWGVPRESP